MAVFLLVVFGLASVIGLALYTRPGTFKLGAVLLSLSLLFSGGCSLLFSLPTASAQDPYAPVVLSFSLPILAVSIFLGWLLWRSFKRKLEESTTQPKD